MKVEEGYRMENAIKRETEKREKELENEGAGKDKRE